MKWIVSTPPSAQIIIYSVLARQCKPASSADESYLMDLLNECTAYAEEKMECSLMQRTITATFWADDANDFNSGFPLVNSSVYAFYPHRYRIPLVLPRGPVISITSVQDANGNNLDYIQEKQGNTDEIKLTPNAIKYPVTVVYSAGYASASLIPADIVGAIKTHVATRYMIPEAIRQGTQTVTTNLDDFYAARGHGKQVY